MEDRWICSQLCNAILYVCVIYLFMNLLYMFDAEKKKHNCEEKKVTDCVMNELFLINMINRCLTTKLIALFCPIQDVQRKVAQLVPWFFLEKCIPPDCNIRIGWNKQHSKAKTSFLTSLLWFIPQLLLSISNEGTFSVHIFFSRSS